MPGASAGGVVNKPRTSSVELLYQGSSSEFVDALTSEVLTHVAVRHEYLLRFSRGDYPSMAFAIRDFALQYYVYSSGFTSYLQAVINGLPLQRHRQTLVENPKEEQRVCGSADNVTPHAVLFDRFRRAAGVTETLERRFTPCTTVLVWRDLFLQKCQSPRAGVGVGAIGLATELLVSQIYAQILEGLRGHNSLSSEHHRFFELHIDCDDGHADELLRITEELCQDCSTREAVRFGAFSSLNLRTAFWDVMLARALVGESANNGY